jgi:NADP-dependent 3-hydroxy acid dehydrogenase YdfG
MGRLEGKIAVITGGSSGIGRATALALASEGAAVAIGGRNASALEEVAGAVAAKGGRSLTQAMDVRNEAQVIDLIDSAVQQFGRLDIMVNNAGVSYPSAITDGKVDEWREMLETNILALLVGCREAVRAMKQNEAPRGHIINVSSNATRHDIGKSNQVYAATKHAVNAIGDGLRAEVHELGIRVTTLLPAMTLTNFARNWPQPVLDAAARFVGMDPEKEGVRRLPAAGGHRPHAAGAPRPLALAGGPGERDRLRRDAAAVGPHRRGTRATVDRGEPGLAKNHARGTGGMPLDLRAGLRLVRRGQRREGHAWP